MKFFRVDFFIFQTWAKKCARWTYILLLTDKGTEFLNLHKQNFLKMYQIRFFLDYIFRAKPSIAERFNSTVKGIMFILLTGNSKRRYILLLNEMANTYNKLYHKSIKIKPIEGSKENRPQVWIK